PPLRNLVLPPLAPHPPSATLFPYTTLFRSDHAEERTAGARPEDVESLAQVSLPTSAQASVPAQYDQVRQAWIISGPNPNLRIVRSEEHTSELQSRVDLVCRLLLEKKKYTTR